MLSRQLFFAKAIILTGVACVSLAEMGLAQAPYKEDQPNPALLAKEKQVQQQVGRILRGTAPFNDLAKRQLDAYYNQIALPKFTIKSSWGDLPELRNNFSKELRTAKEPKAIQAAIGALFNKMRSFADPSQNYHPVVRYNAMIMLGELNITERGSRTGPGGRPAAFADPLPAVFDVLVAEYRKPEQIDVVRVAALVGIKRHVTLDLNRPADRRIPGPKKLAIVDEMVSLLNGAPPANRNEAAHTWMQRRGIDILSAAGAVGTYAPANAALEKIVADETKPMSLRCTASEALAYWTPNTREKINATDVSKNLGMIAVKACKDELDRIAALVKQEVEMEKLRELVKKPNPAATGQFTGAGGAGGAASMEGMYGGGGDMEGMYGGGGDEGGGDGMDMEGMYGGGEGMYGDLLGGTVAAVPTDPRIIWSQRRLKHQFTCVKLGLSGMALAGKGSQHEAAVTKVSTAVNEALALTEPPEDKPDLEGLTESIKKAMAKFAFLVPAAAEVGLEPVSELPDSALPPGAEPAAAEPAAAEPAAAAVPPGVPDAAVADPAAVPPAASDLPPGL